VRTESKVTEAIKAEVISTHKATPKLGCWRLSLFEYGGNRLSRTTIWLILKEAKPPKKERQVLYVITRLNQIWFIDHMHLRTLKNGQKVYSLIVVDGMSRVLFSDEVILSKSARDAVKVLIRAFARWGMPDEIVSDNAKAFESLLYTLVLSRLEIRISHTLPGCPWENGHAESLVGTLRDYLYPHIQRQQTVGGTCRIYRAKVDYYNNREHWEFQKDEIKTPFGKLAGQVGRPMPEDFSLEVIETTKPSNRTICPQGWISIRRYQLYVNAQLAKEKVEIREFITNVVITYAGSAVVTYKWLFRTFREKRNFITNSTNRRMTRI
jgi:transposase InsO family protein